MNMDQMVKKKEFEMCLAAISQYKCILTDSYLDKVKPLADIQFALAPNSPKNMQPTNMLKDPRSHTTDPQVVTVKSIT